ASGRTSSITGSLAAASVSGRPAWTRPAKASPPGSRTSTGTRPSTVSSNRRATASRSRVPGDQCWGAGKVRVVIEPPPRSGPDAVPPDEQAAPVGDEEVAHGNAGQIRGGRRHDAAAGHGGEDALLGPAENHGDTDPVGPESHLDPVAAGGVVERRDVELLGD